MIAWVYGSGFPKSLNIGKVVDKLQGNDREDAGFYESPENTTGWKGQNKVGAVDFGASRYKDGEKRNLTKGTSEWEGWGTALKPALEPITVARKPLSEKTVAENALKWGTGGINIDGCRVGVEERTYKGSGSQPSKLNNHSKGDTGIGMMDGSGKDLEFNVTGRFPANLIHDGSGEVVSLFPNTSSHGGGKTKIQKGYWLKGGYIDYEKLNRFRNDSGSASRFFYCAKASKRERNAGCEELEEKYWHTHINNNNPLGIQGTVEGYSKNNHPTVKPLALMEYLIKLVTPLKGTVLDPFAGSGTTGVACKNLNRNYILIEKEPEYCKIAEERIKNIPANLI